MEQQQLLTLIEKSRAGDRQAQERLVSEAQNRVYYHCKKMLKNEEDALDATQDVLLTMLTSLDKLREPAAFWGWVNGITANRCKHLLTQGTKEWQIPEDEEGNSLLDTLENLDDQLVPDRAIDSAETQRLIMGIIDGLSPEQKMTMLFYYYDEMPVKDIAEAMAVSEGTVKSRLNYARKSIRDEVEKLEKRDGTKLYSVSILPFLAYFLRRGAEGQALSPAAAAALTQNALASTEVAGATAAGAGAAAGTATAGTAASGAGAAVDGAATKAAAGLSVNLIAGVLAGAMALGGVGAGVYVATHREAVPVSASAAPGFSTVQEPDEGTLPQEPVKGTLPQELEPYMEELLSYREAEDLQGIANLIRQEEFQTALANLEWDMVYEGAFSQKNGDVFRLCSPTGNGYLGGWEQGQREGYSLWFSMLEQFGESFEWLYLGNWSNDLPNGQGVDAFVNFADGFVDYQNEYRGNFTNGLYDGVLTNTSHSTDGLFENTAQITYISGFAQPLENLPESYYDGPTNQWELEKGNSIVAIGENGTVIFENCTRPRTVSGFSYLASEGSSPQSQPTAKPTPIPEPTPTPEPTPEPTPTPVPEEYASLYTEKVRELMETQKNGNYLYGLVYINEDSTPELIVSDMSYVNIYTVSGGELHTVREGWTEGRTGPPHYYPGKNVIAVLSSVYSSVDGYTNSIHTYYQINGNMEPEEFFRSEGVYYWDGREGTKATVPEGLEGLKAETLNGSMTAQEFLELLSDSTMDNGM